MLRHMLLNPSGYFHHVLHQAGQLLGTLALYLVLPAILLAVLLAAARTLTRARRQARFAADARQVMILAPPQASPEGGRVLWTNLTGLLRSPWRRLVSGQPHLAFEYCWNQAGARISVWVPGTIPPGLVERAAEAAWPGALTRTSPAAPPVPPGSAIEAGTLRLARPDHYPLRSDHDADPLRPCPPPSGVWARERPRCGRCWPSRWPGPGCCVPAVPPPGCPAAARPVLLPSCWTSLHPASPASTGAPQPPAHTQTGPPRSAPSWPRPQGPGGR